MQRRSSGKINDLSTSAWFTRTMLNRVCEVCTLKRASRTPGRVGFTPKDKNLQANLRDETRCATGHQALTFDVAVLTPHWFAWYSATFTSLKDHVFYQTCRAASPFQHLKPTVVLSTSNRPRLCVCVPLPLHLCDGVAMVTACQFRPAGGTVYTVGTTEGCTATTPSDRVQASATQDLAVS
eukprot:6198109-Pleurochrysis_carterae.AAC.1